MVKALAPSLRKGSSWVWLWIVIAVAAAAAAPGRTLAQAPDTKGGAATKAAPKAAAPATKSAPVPAPAAKAAEPEPPAAAEQAAKDSGQLFKDENTEAALPNTFAQLPYPTPRPTPQDITTVRNMASGLVQPDRALIDRYVASHAAELSNRANIRAVLEPPAVKGAQSSVTRAIERASVALIDPITIARSQQPPNQAFLALYIPSLQTRLVPLLDNHLLARIEASIALGTAGTQNLLDVYLKQLANEKQVPWVKLWSARGITNVTQNGQVALEITKGGNVAATLVKVLEDATIPWPVHIRVLEALGYNRLASSTVTDKTADVLSAVAAELANFDSRADVRAWAAWAAGLINVGGQIPKVNFQLLTYHVGLLAAEIGDRIVAEYDKHAANFERNKGPASYLTGLLVYQIGPALTGNVNLRGSGLANNQHASASANKAFATQTEALVREVAKAGVELVRAGGTAQKAARDKVAAKTADLRTFLNGAKNKPTELELIPGGEKFPIVPEGKP